MDIQKIGVVGGGQMGSGIAQVCAQAGYSVVLVDVSANALSRAHDTISRSDSSPRLTPSSIAP